MTYTTAFAYCGELIEKGLSYVKKNSIERHSLDDHQQAIYDLSFNYAELRAAENFQEFAKSKSG